MKRRFREPGTVVREPLAIKHDADVFSLFFAEPVTENYEVNGAVVVTIRGPLEHHDCGYGESYEAVRARFGEALASDAPAIILRIDSPGGVVSGLNQCVYDMRRAKRAMGKRVYAYVDEMACSAAYAIACVSDEIIIPPSGIAGSIGVISLMYDQVGLDQKLGLNFVTITSGERKADGHPHVAVSDDAVAAEQARVDKLAAQFYRIVERARPMGADDARALQAGIFLGNDAVRSGVADDVMGWEGLLAAVAAVHGNPNAGRIAPASATTQLTAKSQQDTLPSKRSDMTLQIKALIAQTKKAIVAEGDAKARAALAVKLAQYEATAEALKKTKIKYEESSEESEESEEEESSESEESEESESGGNETDRKEDDMPGDKPADDDDDDGCDEEDEEEEESEESRAALAELRALATKAGGKAAAVLANLMAERKANRTLAKRVARIERNTERRECNAKIDAAVGARRITKAEANTLRAKSPQFVAEYLSMRKTAIVRAPSEALTADVKIPADIDNAHPEGLSPSAGFSREETAENERMIADIVARSGGKITREQVIKDYHARLNGLTGGPKGRY